MAVAAQPKVPPAEQDLGGFEGLEAPEFQRRPAPIPLGGKLPRITALALLAPLAVVASLLHLPLAAFPLALLGLVGGAFLLGEAAEEVAGRLGEGLGALVLATLSNLVTLTIVGATLLEGLYDVVRAALAGAILSNLLVALGGAMVLGGWKREKQTFGREAAAVNATLLMVAAFGLLTPGIADLLFAGQVQNVGERLTIPIALVLAGVYIAGLLFSTRTHRHLFNPARAAERHVPHPFIQRHALPVLVGSVVLVAALAETLAENVVPVGERIGLSGIFLGIVVIGLVANSVEIAAAWQFARRDRMNVTIQIATGSAIQVMLFVVPVLVLASLALDTGLLSLEFPMAMVAAIGMAIVLVNIVASDGESTWYEGVLLLALYAILASVFLLHP